MFSTAGVFDSRQRYGRVAGFAQAHQVCFFISAAFGGVNDVMNFGRRNEVASFKAPLTERMLGDI